MAIEIHPTAIVDEKAELGEGTKVGPYAIIEADAKLGENCIVEAHAVIRSYTTMGSGNHVHPHAVIGNYPQDLGFDKCAVSYLEIGNDNEFREFSNIHRSKFEGGKTLIGNECYIMSTAHIGHDSVVGNNVIMTNCAELAGHVSVDDNVFISSNTGVHQYCKIGAYCIVGANSKITQDVPPFSLVQGIPAKVYKLNLVGLRRNGFSKEDIREIEEIHDTYYAGGMSRKEFLVKMKDSEGLSEHVARFVDFVSKSERGVCPHI